mgnify:CR=1 FL=1
MALEFAAESWLETHTADLYEPSSCLPLANAADGRFLLPTGSLVSQLTTDFLAGGTTAELAYRFHTCLAGQILSGCQQAAADTGVYTVALSGGVFQNQLLLKLCTKALLNNGFQVLLHSLIPPNDGGIALGQALAAIQTLQAQ